MNAALLTTVLQLLQTLGPLAAQAVENIRSSGEVTPEELAKWDAMIEDMDKNRLASWAAADAALSDQSTG